MNKAAFIDHLKGLAKDNKIARIEFDQTSDLGFVSKHLSELVVVETEGKDIGPDETIESVIDTLDTHTETIEGKELFNMLDKIAGTITAVYQENKQYLTNVIGAKVESLCDNILKERENVIKENGLAPAFDIKDETPMSVMNWEGISLLGGKEAIETAIKNITRLELHEPSKAGVMYTIPRLKSFSDSIKEEIDVHEVADSISKIIDKDKSEIDVTIKALEMLFDGPTAHAVMNSFCYDLRSGEGTPRIMALKANQIIKDVYPVMDVVSKMPFEGSIAGKEFLQKSLENNKMFLTMLGYYLVFTREKYFNQSALMDEDIINGDLLDDMEDLGISNEDLKVHVLTNYSRPGIPISTTGVFLSEIEKSKERNAEKLDKLITMDTNYKNNILIDATSISFRRVLSKDTSMDKLWQRNLESDNNFIERKNRSIQYSANFLSGEDRCIEDTLYRYFITMDRNSEVLGGLYEAFTLELTNKMENTDSINSDLVEDTERNVLSKVVLNAINSAFCNE